MTFFIDLLLLLTLFFLISYLYITKKEKREKQALLSLVGYQFYMENITVLFKSLINSASYLEP